MQMRDKKLKICGMVHRDNILDVAAFHPDFMGFIFYEGSPRYVGMNFEIPKSFPAEIKKVGVFVNETPEKIIGKARRYHLDIAQLHGEESPAICQMLKKEGIEVIKVFAVDNEFDFETLTAYEPFVDYFLFDTKGKMRGGNGIPFDWSILKDYRGATPYFLSGGINAENVGQISQLQDERLQAIDVNSGVEDQPGLKSVIKLNELIKKFKQ